MNYFFIYALASSCYLKVCGAKCECVQNFMPHVQRQLYTDLADRVLKKHIKWQKIRKRLSSFYVSINSIAAITARQSQQG